MNDEWTAIELRKWAVEASLERFAIAARMPNTSVDKDLIGSADQILQYVLGASVEDQA